MTGSRIKHIEKYIDTENFMATYGDGVADIDIDKLLEFHYKHKKIATLTGVHSLSRFGELSVEGDDVKEFKEKPQFSTRYINGGFFVFRKRIFDYFTDGDDCVLEDVLGRLAHEGELKIFPHTGFWQCVDTYRDFKYLQEIWKKGYAPWAVWK